LTDPKKLDLTPKSSGSKNPWSFLFLVNATIPFLSGLTTSQTSLHHISTVERAHCMNPDTVFGNLPTARRHVIYVSFDKNTASTEPATYVIYYQTP